MVRETASLAKVVAHDIPVTQPHAWDPMSHLFGGFEFEPAYGQDVEQDEFRRVMVIAGSLRRVAPIDEVEARPRRMREGAEEAEM